MPNKILTQFSVCKKVQLCRYVIFFKHSFTKVNSNFKSLEFAIFLQTLFALLIIFSSISCKKDNQKEQEFIVATNIDSTISNNDSVITDNIKIVTDTQILFFMPSPKKRTELIKFYGYYNQYDFQTMFSNFIQSKNSVKQALRRYKINVEITYADKFIFPLDSDTLTYDLEIEKQILGYIISDGKNMPIIKNGIQKNTNISNDIRNYFNLAGFSM